MLSPILILASSRKPGGVCLAGKRLDGEQRGAWVRPVWESTGHGWSAGLLGIRAGRVPAVGDVFELPLAVPQPWAHQCENWQIGAGVWGYAGHRANRELIPFSDEEMDLWENGWRSTSGFNDRVPVSMSLREGEGSLRLIRPSGLTFVAEEFYGRRKLRAQFFHRGTLYRLCVTDLLACERWNAKLAAGHNSAADALLCISLGQPLDGYCYKLVAGVIELS